MRVLCRPPGRPGVLGGMAAAALLAVAVCGHARPPAPPSDAMLLKEMRQQRELRVNQREVRIVREVAPVPTSQGMVILADRRLIQRLDAARALVAK